MGYPTLRAKPFNSNVNSYKEIAIFIREPHRAEVGGSTLRAEPLNANVDSCKEMAFSEQGPNIQKWGSPR